MADKPIIRIALHPGQYLVDVHPSHKPRVWKHMGEGVFVGHGSKVRRVAISDVLRDLVIEAESQEGIPEASWKTPSTQHTETYNITTPDE